MKDPLAKKLIAGFTIIAISVFILAYLTYRNNQTHEDNSSLVRHTQQVLFVSEEIAALVKDLQNSTRGYVITGDPAFMQPFEERRRMIFVCLDSLNTLAADEPSQQKRIDTLRSLTEKKLMVTGRTLAQAAAGRFEEAQKSIQTKEGLNYMHEVDRLIDSIQAEENRLLKIREQINAQSNASFRFFFAIQTVGLLLIIAFFAGAIFVSLRAQKRAERLLQENQQMLQAIIDNTTSLIYVKATDGRFTSVNRHFAKRIGLPAEQILGKTAFAIFPAEVAAGFQAMDDRILQEKTLVEHEEIVPHEGEDHYYYTIKFPLLSAAGVVYGICGISTNITRVILKQEVTRQKQIAVTTIEAQEKQRTEIGKELHDNIQQILVSANMMIGLALTDAAQQRSCLEKGKQYILSGIEEVRKLSHAMVAPSFSEKPFMQALEELAEGINLAGGLYVLVTVDAEAPLNALADSIKLALYRIVQEQVSNVLKYAGAKEMRITLQLEAKKVYLSITDNGRGFDPEKTAQGIGLQNMASRAEILGGKMKIISAPGRGCTLHAEIPV